MEISFAATHVFSASHVAPCGLGQHGHDFIVEVWVRGALRLDGTVCDPLDLKTRLAAVAGEFSDRDLGKMLVPETPEQLCLYFRERLALWYPNVSRVVIRAGSFFAEVEFPIR